MRKLLLLALFSLSLCTPALAQSTADFEQLEPTLERFLEGASANDEEIHDAFWHADLTYTSSSGKRFGKQELMEGVISAGPTEPVEGYSQIYSAENFSYKAFGDLVVINFVLVSETDSNAGYGREEFYNSGVMLWQDSRWQAINWHATRRME
ncbi:nuclear transport factor 2 family protein [Aliidiomarina shirensis]|uniref:Nuclear transport factor 2 family protein n=1 Tax=Aliidiomarina shirensis TaxID=1048642 RepID=A0A432WT36_9GAMM|nr:nuclear transport factor 2 family protein [Aliidiomarina shirensis]RUO36914.1 nuclear transport factor 2 family protein [Aliidiomarina shirensis]